MQIVFVLDLSELKMTEVQGMGNVLVIGGEDVSLDWKVGLTDSRIQTVYSDFRLPLGDESPFGILLMAANDKKQIKDVKLSKRDANGKFLPRVIDFNFDVMRQFTLDMLVYGRKVHSHRCSVFEKIMQRENFLNNGDRIEFQGEQYLLRDYDDPNGEDSSISRCASETKPFVPRR